LNGKGMVDYKSDGITKVTGKTKEIWVPKKSTAITEQHTQQRKLIIGTVAILVPMRPTTMHVPTLMPIVELGYEKRRERTENCPGNYDQAMVELAKTNDWDLSGAHGSLVMNLIVNMGSSEVAKSGTVFKKDRIVLMFEFMSEIPIRSNVNMFQLLIVPGEQRAIIYENNHKDFSIGFHF
jgi:hypothetical protein